MNFNEHRNDILSEASRYVKDLSIVVPYISLSKNIIVRNSFFNSQFSYFGLIWLFHRCIMNNKINQLHERCMRLIYGVKTSTFEELLENGKSFWYTFGATKCWLQNFSYNFQLFRPSDISYTVIIYEVILIWSTKRKTTFSWRQKYFLPRSENLGYCNLGAESINYPECLQK